MASRVKGYQGLPLLTFCRHRLGGEPGNEANFIHKNVMVASDIISVDFQSFSLQILFTC